MSTPVELYTFESKDGTPHTFTTFSAIEAKSYGEQWHLRVVAQIYEWSDSELVWDFTE